MQTKRRFYGYFILIIAILALAALPFLFSDLSKVANPTFIRNLILSSGGFGYVLLVLVVMASIPLPIPTVPSIMAGGYLYGIWTGSALSLIGIIIGSSISFLLVRKFGRPLLEKFVDKHHIEHFNHVFRKRGLAAVLISYALPIFPSDAVSSIMGLTRTSYKAFLGLVIIGHIPRILLINSLGEDFLSGFSWTTILILVISVLFVLIAAFREKIKKFMFKELHEIEKEVDIVERKVGLKKRRKKK